MFGTRNQYTIANYVTVDDLAIKLVDLARNLRIIFDKNLNMDTQVKIFVKQFTTMLKILQLLVISFRTLKLK